MFGGVYDTEETEESLTSTFFNSLYSYQAEANRWYSLRIRAARRTQIHQQKQAVSASNDDDLEQNLSQILKKLNIDLNEMKADEDEESELKDEEEVEASTKEYPVINTAPHPRFNATLCVCGDTLYIYCGTWEDGDREYAFDSFYAVDIAKLDGVKVFWEELGLGDGDDSGDSEAEEEDEEEDDDEDMPDRVLVAEDAEEDEDETEEVDDNDPRPWLPHPKPFESVGQFYSKHMNAFVEWALRQEPDARGKDLRTHAFELSRSRWWERRETVQVVEDQLEEAGGVSEVVERSRSSRR